MTEASATSTLRTKLLEVAAARRERIAIQRIEDKLTPGVADMNVCLGGREFWMEGKHVKALPVRASTPVKLDHPLQPEQRNWLLTRQAAGSRAFVWVRVIGAGWLLFDRDFEQLMKEGMPRDYFNGLPIFTNATLLIQHVITEIDNDSHFGRPLY